MSDFIEFDADTREFEAALVRFQRATQLGWPEVIKMQARLLVERLIEWTPPFGKSKAAQTQGKKRVEGDIRRVFIPFKDVPFLVKEMAQARLDALAAEKNLEAVKFANPKIQKVWSRRDWDAMRAIFANSAQAKASSMRIMRAPDPAEHQRVRVNGRVRKGRKPSVVIEKEAALKAYIRRVQERVGKAKAGWIAAARFLAAKFPVWIVRSGGENFSRVSDQSNNPDNPSITISNELDYISDIFPASKMQELLASRVRDMQRNAEKYLRAKASKSF